MELCLKTIFLFAGLIGIFGCAKETNSKYISENVSLYDPKIITDVINESKITTEQAMNSVESLQQAFKTSYVGYNLKKSLIGKSGDEIFAACKADLAQNTQALSSFELYDYVLKCIAGIKDSHLSLTKIITPGNVTTAISETVTVDGKLYISRIRPNLIEKFESLQNLKEGTLSDKIKVGTEITLIDGETPSQQITKLSQYIAESSELAMRHDAELAMFNRSFNYPTKSNVEVTLKLEDGTLANISLPWIQYITPSRQGSIESRTILSGRGIVKSSDLSSDTSILSSKGVDTSLPLFQNLSALRTFQDADENDVLVTGIASLNGKNYCYMQLNSFEIPDDEQLKYKIFEKVGDKPQAVSFLETLKNYLRSCETFQAPMIFDLRENGGGDATVADMVYALFESKSSIKSYAAKSALINIGNFGFLARRLQELDQKKAPLVEQLLLKALQDGISEKAQATGWIATRDLSLVRSLFTGEVSILTSSNCVSACESTVSRFKKIGRAKIFGEATNGTGFGFSSMGSDNKKAQSKYRDPMNFYEITIPNHAFNSAIIEDESKMDAEEGLLGTVLPFESIQLLENNPTTPDVEIKYTLKDLKGNFSDYVESLSKALQ